MSDSDSEEERRIAAKASSCDQNPASLFSSPPQLKQDLPSSKQGGKDFHMRQQGESHILPGVAQAYNVREPSAMTSSTRNPDRDVFPKPHVGFGFSAHDNGLRQEKDSFPQNSGARPKRQEKMTHTEPNSQCVSLKKPNLNLNSKSQRTGHRRNAASHQANFSRDNGPVPGILSVSQGSILNGKKNVVQGTKYNSHLLASGLQQGIPNDGSSFEVLHYRKLKEWADSNNNILLLFEMNSHNHRQGLSKMLERDILSFEEVIMLLTVFAKILKVEHQKGSLELIMQCMCKSKFLSTHLKRFLSELQERKDFPDVYSNLQKIVDVLEFVITKMKDYLSLCTGSLQMLLQVGKLLGVLTKEDCLTVKAQNLLKTSECQPSYNVQEIQDAVSKRKRRERLTLAPDHEVPPDDFSTLTLFPDTEEIYSPVEPYLRANKTRGAYRDLKHYLDIHARLMREDYIEPIRTGLKDFKRALQNEKPPKENELRFYYHVQIVKIAESDHGISHFITFDKNPFESLEWKHSKRLLFGALLVFSKDMFENTIFATVAHRDEEKLSRGILQVVFENNLEEVFTSAESDTFVMAETTAFFESYRHVLEGLQEFRKMPLERYVIACKRELLPPCYLQFDAHYNMAAIMQREYDNFPVAIQDDCDWPNAEETTLNESQLDALKLALTKELAVIQGPPGTGKTYVGLKIMKVLLNNNITLQSKGKAGPILVVCYTNHALDQFLEGVLDFCPDGIIRVGFRSSSTRLENFNLNELRKKTKRFGKTKEHLENCRRQLRGICKKINRFWQESLKLDTVIMNVNDLCEEIDKELWDSLNDPSRSTVENPHIMSAWLKATNVSMENHLHKAAKRHLAKVIAGGQACQSDVGLTDKLAVAKTDFFTRVRIYNYWLASYKQQLEGSFNNLCISNSPTKESEMQKNLIAQDEAYSNILSDEKLTPFINPRVYKLIIECVKTENRHIEKEDYLIEAWLFGILNRTDQILDAIEKLLNETRNTKETLGRRRHEMMQDVDPDQKRWVIEASDDSDSNPDDQSETDSSDSEEIDMDNVDDGGTVAMDNIREIESTWNLSSNKDMVMLQRAKMLGVDLTEPQQENPEWKTAGEMSYNKVFTLYHNTVPYTASEVSRISDVWNMRLPERYKLYKYWINERKKKMIQRLIDLTSEYKLILQQQRKLRSKRDIRILKKAAVIGMTTTGAARHRAVLQEVGCPIIVIEEAAEVLEAHIVTTLNRHCQHLILIGDHQQLRPNPTVHKLAVDCELEISLFERLVRNGVPHVTLDEQHRMRPEISIYLQHIYPNLCDHISVMLTDDVRGVDSNVFFLHHVYEESDVDDTTSKANLHEAKFLTKLCKYFLQHDYKANQITVLAAYSAQVGAIRTEMEIEDDSFSTVRVTSIDNYQGEENDIILLSLVRSNRENEVGFLKTDNRVCVALSRAKKGLFVIGNIQLLASKSKLWDAISTTAKDQHVIGTFMKLVCVNHAHHVTYVTNAEDFQNKVPEGGCDRQCDFVLHCGHSCVRMCHASDRFHEETLCEQPCGKKCPQGHQCQKKCYEECGNCMVLVNKRIPTCGHEDRVPCHQDVEAAVCSQSCEWKLPCGHTCRGQCGICLEQERHHPCLEIIEKEWPCGHKDNVECYKDVTEEPCPRKCRERLECGHSCKGTCGTCLSGRVHIACKEKCKDPLPCGHPCQGPCSGLCIPCRYRCQTECRHGSCLNSYCGEPCIPCVENCALVCRHKRCNQRCLDECEAPLCNRPCGELVPSCNHRCWSLCGEQCVCYHCNKDKFHLIDTSNKKKPQYVVAHDKRERARKFDITREILLMQIPKCGHIFTLNQLDKYMSEVDASSSAYIRCPVCPAATQRIARYETQNKQRAERRERLKENLVKCATISELKVQQLKESKKLLHDFCVVDEGDFILSKPDQIDSNHALALTMQIRFAYCLKEIYTIHMEMNSENEGFKLQKWKVAVMAIQRSVPHQLQKEMTLELHRLLLREQIFILVRLTRDVNLALTDEIKSGYRTILKDTRKQKLSGELKEKAQTLIDELYSLISTSVDQPKRAVGLKHRVAGVEKILAQPQTEDLCNILS